MEGLYTERVGLNVFSPARLRYPRGKQTKGSLFTTPPLPPATGAPFLPTSSEKMSTATSERRGGSLMYFIERFAQTNGDGV